MNERIEAYLKQHHCRDYFTSYGETVHDDHYFMYREEVEGLIELIVKECAKVVDIWSDEVPPSEGYDKLTVGKLKEHFGVKE